jgi:uncharacterized repeat protein (TIGR03803 family)
MCATNHVCGNYEGVGENKMTKILRVVMAACFSAMILMFVVPAFGATQYKILYNFKGNENGADAGNPYSALVMDSAGNLYGTTVNGGYRNSGTVFELSPQSGGAWSETLVHTFTDFSSDGTQPYASLTFDASGNLYGTTWGGGVNGYGVVFELSPQGGGVWSETILHSFPGNTNDGQRPFSGVVFDSAGNLFGTANAGGPTCGCGSIYELTRSGGAWTEKVVRNFTSTGPDGWSPYTGNLVFDSLGNLYGATLHGGPGSAGAIFEFKPKAGGGLTESIVFDFTSAGGSPYNGLLIDAKGNIYATIYGGGGHNGGAAVEFTPNTNGHFTGKVLHSFNSSSKDGTQPFAAGLVMDAAGNLYGTTYRGGAYGYGTVYELIPQPNGKWTEKILHSFNNDGIDGNQPAAGLLMDSAGNLYGTTWSGGSDGQGAVFEITP